MELLRLTLPAGGRSGSEEYGHPGMEAGYIVRGNGRFSLGEETVDLGPGDCVTFTARFPHRIENTGKGELEAIWVLNPPRAERKPPVDPARARTGPGKEGSHGKDHHRKDLRRASR
jgi:mannose-6-phosphate isomerase-like protein (cupin superfamily)